MSALERAQTPQTEVIARALQLVSEKELRDLWLTPDGFDDDVISAEGIDYLIGIIQKKITEGYAILANPLDRPPQFEKIDTKAELEQIQAKETLLRELMSYRQFMHGLESSLLPHWILEKLQNEEYFLGPEILAFAEQVELFFLEVDYQDNSIVHWELIEGREKFFKACWELFQRHFDLQVTDMSQLDEMVQAKKDKTDVVFKPYSFGNYAWMEYAKNLSTSE